jgi:hypothetical protein
MVAIITITRERTGAAFPPVEVAAEWGQIISSPEAVAVDIGMVEEPLKLMLLAKRTTKEETM